MPELRLQKARASLPEGYQFGDARPSLFEIVDGWMDAIGAQSIVRDYVTLRHDDGTTEQIPIPQRFRCR